MTRILVGPRLVLHEIEDIVERIPVFREQQYLLVGLFFEQLLDVSTYFLGLRVDRDSSASETRSPERLDFLFKLCVTLCDSEPGELFFGLLLILFVEVFTFEIGRRFFGQIGCGGLLVDEVREPTTERRLDRPGYR